MAKRQKTNKKKVIKKNVERGVVHIFASFNNTIVTISDVNGNVVSWSSSGMNGFKGARKSTPFAAQVTSEQAAKKAVEQGMKEVRVKVKGPGVGRESAIRALESNGLKVLSILDITPIPHNGCRSPKRRRV